MSIENRNKLINTFKSVLKAGEETAVEDLVIGEHSKWDSLAQVVLLSAWRTNLISLLTLMILRILQVLNNFRLHYSK